MSIQLRLAKALGVVAKCAQTGQCQTCGRHEVIDLLDCKPRSLLGVWATQKQLTAAADAGEDFDRLECIACYGPEWLPTAEGELTEITLHADLIPLYEQFNESWAWAKRRAA